MHATQEHNTACFSCGKPLPFPPGQRVPKNETCEFCDNDVRCCLNCKFYDPSSYNECKESQAERVLDKDRANFCDYFALKSTSGKSNKEADSGVDAISARLADLLKGDND